MDSKVEEAFEKFWSVKPKRRGSNPKDLARIKFTRCVVNGCDPEKIISAAQQWAAQERENGKDGTEYVAMAVTWLNQKRFNDYSAEPISDVQAQNEAIANSKGWFWSGEKWEFRGVPA